MFKVLSSIVLAVAIFAACALANPIAIPPKKPKPPTATQPTTAPTPQPNAPAGA